MIEDVLITGDISSWPRTAVGELEGVRELGVTYSHDLRGSLEERLDEETTLFYAWLSKPGSVICFLILPEPLMGAATARLESLVRKATEN